MEKVKRGASEFVISKAISCSRTDLQIDMIGLAGKTSLWIDLMDLPGKNHTHMTFSLSNVKVEQT